MFPFDNPENIRKPLSFLFFQGYQKGTLGRKRLGLNGNILDCFRFLKLSRDAAQTNITLLLHLCIIWLSKYLGNVGQKVH